MTRRTTPRRAASETDLVAQVVDHALSTLDVEGHVRSWNAGADRVSVERIVVNLVGNALHYSEPGTVVEVRCDPGRSIAERDLPHIFTEFERGPLARDDGGAGLGLAGVKTLVAANGGRIVVESEVGTGTTVAVDFPHRA